MNNKKVKITGEIVSFINSDVLLNALKQVFKKERKIKYSIDIKYCAEKIEYKTKNSEINEDEDKINKYVFLGISTEISNTKFNFLIYFANMNESEIKEITEKIKFSLRTELIDLQDIIIYDVEKNINEFKQLISSYLKVENFEKVFKNKVDDIIVYAGKDIPVEQDLANFLKIYKEKEGEEIYDLLVTKNYKATKYKPLIFNYLVTNKNTKLYFFGTNIFYYFKKDIDNLKLKNDYVKNIFNNMEYNFHGARLEVSLYEIINYNSVDYKMRIDIIF